MVSRRLSQSGLMLALKTHIIELKFSRRREKYGWSPQRRMLCTNAYEILNSAPGLAALRFKAPTYAPSYNWKSKNLVCTWDLFWQDWRMVPVESCDVITLIPVNPPDLFWGYFNIYLQSLSPSEKVAFMNK